MKKVLKLICLALCGAFLLCLVACEQPPKEYYKPSKPNTNTQQTKPDDGKSDEEEGNEDKDVIITPVIPF